MSKQYIYIHPDDFVGAVKLNNNWRIFYADLSEWILSYESYGAPEEDLSQWRGGLINVDENNAEEFCNFLAKHEIRLDDISKLRSQGMEQQEPLTFVVNFDGKLFVNGWRDMLPIHTWIPKHWDSKRDLPYSYIPPSLAELWDE